jgi:Recombination endonuclease VII
MSKLQVEEFKKCLKCHKELPYTAFTLCRKYRYHGRNRLVESSYYASYCKPCASENTRVRKLARKYGLTVAKFKGMLAAQENKCYLCSIEMQEGGKYYNRVCIDHNHKTGKVRALLCFKCNVGLAMFNENPEVLIKASQYIQDRY